MSFLLSALMGRPVAFNTDFEFVEDIAADRVLLRLHGGLHSYLQSVGFFWFMYDSTVNLVKTFLTYGRSRRSDLIYEMGTGWYP